MKLSASDITSGSVLGEIVFCMSSKGGTEGGRCVHPKGANSVAMSELGCRKASVGVGGLFLSTFA